MIVVGSGIAGLTVAGRLAPMFDVVVIDKGRGVGGRLASRRIGEATFDHGAQFFTTHSPEFAEMVHGWEDAGVARPWFRGRIGPHGVIDADGHLRYRGHTTMTAVAKHLAVGVDVRLGTRVEALRPVENRWIVHTEAAGRTWADAVVLTAPAPPSLELMTAGTVKLERPDRESLEAIRYEPCLAALVPLRGPSGLGEPGAIDPEYGPIDWMADNQTKGVSAMPCVTIHATAGFSHTHRASSDETVIGELVRAAALRSDPIQDLVQTHRWRYARPSVIHPDRCLVIRGPAPLVCAGDVFGGAKVEGAALSGLAASEAVTQLLG